MSAMDAAVEVAALRYAKAITGNPNPIVRAHHRVAVRPLVEAATPHIAAAALREAADTWSHGQWADAPRRSDRVQERIANAQHVGDWLRDRADRIANGGGG